ncbi:MAG TPA: hypothetical protein VMK31_02530 [Sphingomicrobium sp.]|nr:hypothetical protein [Sphingomicrobium sp.]
MESDARYFQRRAREEFAAAKRAVTPAARDRRTQLAEIFSRRFEAAEASDSSSGAAESPSRNLSLRENA